MILHVQIDEFTVANFNFKYSALKCSAQQFKQGYITCLNEWSLTCHVLSTIRKLNSGLLLTELSHMSHITVLIKRIPKWI
jgi:hypothetical protein